MKTIKGSNPTYTIITENLDIKTLVTLIAGGHIDSHMGIMLIAKACSVDEQSLIDAIRRTPKAVRRSMKWTSEEEQTIIKMWNEGKTAREIGDALNRTSGSVGLRITNLRTAGHKLITHETGRRKTSK